jgi:hypothetical protein
MAANKHRGEVEITLDGKSFTLRPTFQAMVEIEAVLGKGLLGLVRRISEMEFGYTEAQAVITAGLRAAGEKATPEKVGEMVFRTGLAELAGPIGSFLTAALSGGAEPGEGGATGSKRKS